MPTGTAAVEVGESPAVVPLGGGLLCWMNSRRRGILIADVFEERLTLHHVRYPDDYWYGTI